eukprot:scaffold189862_cov34-Tisochrysis_lutea.AAC.2
MDRRAAVGIGRQRACFARKPLVHKRALQFPQRRPRRKKPALAPRLLQRYLPRRRRVERHAQVCREEGRSAPLAASAPAPPAHPAATRESRSRSCRRLLRRAAEPEGAARERTVGCTTRQRGSGAPRASDAPTPSNFSASTPT